MSVVVYPAVVSSLASGIGEHLTAQFPDMPTLMVSGNSPADLIRAAREALSAELQRRASLGDTWPEPSALGGLEVPPGGSILLVDVSVDDTPVRLTISLGERLLKRIDEDASARSMTRSGYLALGARRLLGEPNGRSPFGGGLFGAGSASESDGEAAQKLHEEVAALGRRVNETLGPNSPIGRTLAELDAIALDGLRRLGGEVRSALRTRAARPSEDAEAPPRPTDTGA